MFSLKQKLEYWITGVVLKTVAIGGHCGLCGKWASNHLVENYWRVTICDDCIKAGTEEK